MAEYAVSLDRIIWPLETVNRLNPETTGTNPIEIAVDMIPNRFPAKQLTIGSLEIPLPQLIVEEAWQNVYMDEGVPAMHIGNHGKDDSVRTFILGVPLPNSFSPPSSSFNQTTKPLEKTAVEYRIVLPPAINPVVDVSASAMAVAANGLLEPVANLATNPVPPPDTVSGLLVTTQFEHGLEFVDDWRWNPIYVTGLGISFSSSLATQTSVPLTKEVIEFVSPTSFFVPMLPADAIAASQTVLASVPALLPTFDGNFGFVVAPQIPNSAILASLITAGAQRRGLAGFYLGFDPQNTQFFIKMSAHSEAWDKLFGPLLAREQKIQQQKNPNNITRVNEPLNPNRESTVCSPGSAPSDLSPYISSTLLSYLMGFSSPFSGSKFLLLLPNVNKEKKRNDGLNPPASFCDIRATGGYRGMAKVTIPAGDYDASLLGGIFRMQWNRFHFDSGTADTENLAIVTRQKRLQKIVGAVSSSSFEENKDLHLEQDPNNNNKEVLKQTIQNLLLQPPHVRADPDTLFGLEYLLPALTGQGLGLVSEKSQMPFFVFTTPEGKTETFLVPHGQFTYETLTAYLGAMMSRLDGKRGYKVEYDFAQCRFVIYSLDGAAFDLEFDVSATAQMAMILGFNGTTFRGYSRYESSNPVHLTFFARWGTPYFGSEFEDNNENQNKRGYGARTVPQISTRSQLKRFEIGSIFARPFAARIEAVAGPVLSMVALDNTGETLYAHGLQVGDVVYMRNPVAFDTPQPPARTVPASLNSQRSLDPNKNENENENDQKEQKRQITTTTSGFELPVIKVPVVAVEDAFRFSVHAGILTAGSTSALNPLVNPNLFNEGYRTISLDGVPYFNLHFGSHAQPFNANPIKPIYFGFPCESQLCNPQKGFFRFSSPLMYCIEPPKHLLLVLEDPANSSNTHHTYKGHQKLNILAKLILYPSYQVQKMQEFTVDFAGTNSVTKLKLAFYNPDHTLYQMHGCEWSASLCFIGPRSPISLPSI